ncbi:MAG: isoprenylcysteine carboxylmethyltransferase family protein, partial [Acidobacteriota bacterium]
QNPEPWKPTPELIVEGVYRWTRNPMYLGMSLIQIGIGLALDNGWIVLLVLATSSSVARIAILPEERYLGEKFGDSYRAYQQRVDRWFGRRAS